MATRHDVVFYVPGVGWPLSITKPLPAGGAETQVLMLASSLSRQGLSVAVIAYGSAADLPGSINGVTVIPRPPKRTKQIRFAGKIVEALLVWRSLWDAPSRTVVTRCAGIAVGLVAVYTRLSGRRLVHSSANIVDFDLDTVTPSRRDRFLYNLGIRNASTVVVQTEEQVDMCRKTFKRIPSLVKSIAAPVDAAGGEPTAFLWIGRLAWYKRPLEYVELARALPEAEFWMVCVPAATSPGAGDLGDALQSAATKLPNLKLFTPRPQPEVGALMARAVASVNTADFEGMPNVFLEAWSRGVPALALTHDPGGVISTYGLGGFAHGSRETLIEIARAQWRMRNARRDVSERCRSYVAHHHAPDVVASQWLAPLAGDSAASKLPSQTPEVSPSCVE